MNVTYSDKLRKYLAEKQQSDILVSAFRPKG